MGDRLVAFLEDRLENGGRDHAGIAAICSLSQARVTLVSTNTGHQPCLPRECIVALGGGGPSSSRSLDSMLGFAAVDSVLR